MQTPIFRIVGPSGATLADGLPISAPAIQLHEGAVAEKGAIPPKNLAPGQSVDVLYPLDAERGQKRPMIRLTVMRTDAPEESDAQDRRQALVDLAGRAGTPPTSMLATTGSPKSAARGGRRTRGGKTS